MNLFGKKESEVTIKPVATESVFNELEQEYENKISLAIKDKEREAEEWLNAEKLKPKYIYRIYTISGETYDSEPFEPVAWTQSVRNMYMPRYSYRLEHRIEDLTRKLADNMPLAWINKATSKEMAVDFITRYQHIVKGTTVGFMKAANNIIPETDVKRIEIMEIK